MSKLKTLKDLEWETDMRGDYLIKGSHLKKEAIKWIKERRKECEFALCAEDHLPCNEHQFWMDRFNITEEDIRITKQEGKKK